MTLITLLRLGRVSNLPTVWTNVLAGVVLGGGPPPALVPALAFALSLFYIAGMVLNDAFDHRFDAEHHPHRPIPSGAATLRSVFIAGFILLAAGLAVLVLLAGPKSAWGGGILAVLIILYDASHKKNPLSPVLMALCRVAIYAIAALAVRGSLTLPLGIGAAVLFGYLTLLTLVAKRESHPPRRPWLIGTLVAGICLVDGVLVAALGHPGWAAACGMMFCLTRLLQKKIPGT
jgi:4-hydroxybenzoate polyprenyltransferase